MFVTKLDCNFKRLAKHVPSVYGNLQKMMNQFDVAISYEIHPYMSMMQFDSQDEMVLAALRVEQSFLASRLQKSKSTP